MGQEASTFMNDVGSEIERWERDQSTRGNKTEEFERERSPSPKQQDTELSTESKVALGLGLGVGAVAVGLAGLYLSKKDEEKKDTDLEDDSFCFVPHMNKGNRWRSEGQVARKNFPKDGKSERQIFDDILKIIRESAYVAKNNVEPKLVCQYRDYVHNQYRNEFCRILDRELHKRGIPFEKEKKFMYGEGNYLKPDIYINKIAAVEVKAKKQGINPHDRAQLTKYSRITGLPAVCVNFGTSGEPSIRVF